MLRWEEIVGHEEHIARLRVLIKQEKMPHALLIAGPEGVGKFPVARMTAAALFCRGDDRPCGACASCRALKNGVHPDLTVVEPDGQAIKIEQIRAMQTAVSLAPYLAVRRVVLIRQAEKMTPPAANSLLKTLEEPSGNPVFILIADSRQMLLDTILSRCRVMDFWPLPLEQLARALAERGASPALADALAHLAEGSFGRAVRLLESDGLAMRDQAFELLRQCSAAARPLEDVWRQSAVLAEMERAALLEFLSYMNLIFRDLLVLHSDEQSIRLYNADLREALLSLRGCWSERRLFQAVRQTALTRTMLQSNANARLAAEQYLIQLYEI